MLATNVNMICGGTGLTPMYQLLKYILNSSSDKTKIAMIFANQVGAKFRSNVNNVITKSRDLRIKINTGFSKKCSVVRLSFALQVMASRRRVLVLKLNVEQGVLLSALWRLLAL